MATLKIDEVGKRSYPTNEEELREAVALAGYEVVLENSIDLAEGIDITNDVSVVLNGFVIKSAVKKAFQVKGDFTLTIDGKVPGSAIFGTLYLGSNDKSHDKAKLRVYGGEYHATIADECVFQSNGMMEDCSAYADGASFFSTDCTFYIAGGGSYEFVNCQVQGKTGIYVKSGSLTLTNTKVTATGEKADPLPNGSGCNTTGDAITIDAKAGYYGQVSVLADPYTVLSSQNAFSFRETYTDQSATAVRNLELSNLFQGSVSVSTYFIAALSAGTAKIDTSKAKFTSSDVPEVFIPEGTDLVRCANGLYRPVPEEDAQLTDFFADKAIAESTRKFVNSIKFAPVSDLSKLQTLQGASSESYLQNALKGTLTPGRAIASKVINIFHSIESGNLTPSAQERLVEDAVYVYYVLRKLIAQAQA